MHNNATVVHYLQAIPSFSGQDDRFHAELLRRKGRASPKEVSNAREDNRTVVRQLLDARVFDISPKTWAAIVTKSLEQVKSVSTGTKDGVPTGTSADLMALLEPWATTPFPFPVCYFGIGAGYTISNFQEQMDSRTQDPSQRFPGTATFLGLLVTETGDSCEIVQYAEPGHSRAAYVWLEATRGTPLVGNIPRRHNGIVSDRSAGFRVDPFHQTVAPLLALNLVRFVNEFQTFVVEKEPDRRLWRQKLKTLRTNKARRRMPTPVPHPFYTIDLKDACITVEEAVERAVSRRGVLTYRHDVRQHERLYVHKGALPLAPETADKLTARGYQVFLGQPPLDMLTRMARRTIQPPRGGEWVAVKVVEVAAHVKGPKDAPYIPAVRRARLES